jgi:hypothetical protein
MTLVRKVREERQHPVPEVGPDSMDGNETRTPNPYADGAVSVNSVIERVSETSVGEIDGLMAELQMLRDRLRSKAQQVQWELTQYAQMSQAATQSTRIIADSLSQLKQRAFRG